MNLRFAIDSLAPARVALRVACSDLPESLPRLRGFDGRSSGLLRLGATFRGNLGFVLMAFGLGGALLAQEPAPTPTPATAAKTPDSAFLRGFAALGEPASKETYSVSFTGGSPHRDGTLFAQVKGCARSGYGSSALELPAGRYEFRLLRDGAPPPGVVVRADLARGSTSLLLAALVEGRPTLQVTAESPVPKGGDGIYIYNLLAQPPLSVRIGSRPAVAVPASLQPAILRPGDLAGQPVSLSFLSKRQSMLYVPVEYAGVGRVTAVFLRNEGSQPSVSLAVVPPPPPVGPASGAPAAAPPEAAR